MIGVYDSGVGGLSVLAAIRRLLPDADLVYLADQANMPYGERPIDQVRDLAVRAVGLLVDRGADTVVIACNTASAAALGTVRAAFPAIRIVGMEPAVKPAAASTRSGSVAVLATDTTFRAAGFDELVGRYAEGVRVIAHPCPGWAAAVEESWPAGADAAVAAHLTPILATGVDTLVLACTHYTFLAGVIARVAGPGVILVDPTDAVARQAARVGDGAGSGTTRYLTTGAPDRLRGQIARLLGEDASVSGV